ncbi:hypothetical protein TUM12370_11590 [Salmonella enterica subsp. enterica serovar Choleraesuis]|nr:hypothetical protein TUM12370_11590 [Salmonella enterica subsp. enterica serovar Choleraesuis]
MALVPAALKTCVSLPDVCYRELTPPALTSEIKLIYGKWNQNQALARFIASVNQRY